MDILYDERTTLSIRDLGMNPNGPTGGVEVSFSLQILQEGQLVLPPLYIGHELHPDNRKSDLDTLMAPEARLSLAAKLVAALTEPPLL